MRLLPVVLMLGAGLALIGCAAPSAPLPDDPTSEATAMTEPDATPTDPPTITPTPITEPTATAEPSPTATDAPTSTPGPTLTPIGAPVVIGAWAAAPPMHQARAAHAVVSAGDAIYALAGTGEGRLPVREVERFDGEMWRRETTLPGDGLNAPAAAYLDGKIYLIGGFNTTTNVPSAGVLIYDTEAGTWSEAAPLPAPRGGHAAVVSGGRIHVIGGGNSSSTINDHSVYDPASDAWVDLAPLPRSEGSPAAVDVDGTIYAIGGRSGRSDFGDVYLYDAAADAWTVGPAIEPRGTAGAVLYCGAIFLFGGESQAASATLDSVLRLDLARGVWEPVTPMPTPRNFARAVLFGESVYVVGGSPQYGSSHASAGSDVVERFSMTCE